MIVMAVDPGYEKSAWVAFDGARVVMHEIEDNHRLRDRIEAWPAVDRMVFEQIESFGMAVGREVFETVFWTGRFFEAAYTSSAPERMTRKAVKLHLCESNRATDANIRTALIDRFGGTERAVGKKASPGPLYGIKSHEWSALAIAVTWWDLHVNARKAVNA